jgi:hypothetical protein
MLLALILLAACGSQPAAPAPTATLGQPGQSIMIDAPAAGAVLANPFELRGRTTQYPAGGSLSYRLLDAGGTQIVAGIMPVAGGEGQPGAFAVLVTYQGFESGPARLEVLEADPAGGVARATATVDVSLGGRGGVVNPTAGPVTVEPTAAPTAATLPTPVTQQAIVFESPPPGAEVGSPMTITGRTSLWPFQGVLSYRVVDGANRQLGAGSFPVSGSPGQPASFTASITFGLPAGGGPLRVEVYDQNAQNNVVTASAALDVRVAPPQAIVIDTPPPGTLVGSPVVITGRTSRFPFQGNLAYRITGASGNLLGEGIVPVSGSPGQPGSFNASISFSLPPGGGAVRVELLDQDANSGTVAARASIDLGVAPPAPAQQQIFIDSPPRGTAVGSPMTVSGRARVFPPGGVLGFMVRDRNGAMLGGGNFPVTRTPDGGAAFVTALTFNLPAGGGDIVLLIGEPSPGSALIGAAELVLYVMPPSPPTAVPPTAGPVQQQIFIETPAPGTLVGSPVVITGRTARNASNGRLFYTITAADNQVLGEGEFPLPPSDAPRFNQQLLFELPAQGGQINLRLFERDSGGAPVAEARIQLVVAPQSPTVQPRTAP